MRKVYSTLLSLVTVAAIVLGLFIHNGGFRPVFNLTFGNDEVVDQDFDIDPGVKKIDMDASLMDITIKEGDKFAAEYHGSKKLLPTFSYDSGDGKLKIKQEKVNSKKINVNKDNKMTITIPKGTKFEDFDLDLNLGKITVDELNALDIDITDNLGDVKLGTVSAEKIDVDANLGNVEIESCNAEKIDISASMGNVEITMAEGRVLDEYEIEAETSLGNVTVGNESKTKSFKQKGKAGKIDIDCSMGDVTIK